jgi:ATP-dependent DNA ligase
MPELAGTILDGEIQHDDFSQTVSIMGSLPELAIKKQEQMGYIKYKVFDIVRHNGVDVTNMGYSDRIKLASQVVAQIKAKYGTDYIIVLPTYTRNKMDLFHKIVGSGGEGLVLKHKDSIYMSSSDSPTRSKMQIKLKKYITDDVVIMGATAPTREYEGILLDQDNTTVWQYYENGDKVTKAWHNGWIGAIRFGKYVEGSLVELGQTSGIDDATKILLSDGNHNIKPEYIGTAMEIGAMEQIKKTGAYRHPRFLRLRPEKNAEECIL